MRRNNYEVNRLINQVKTATPEELMDDYGVELLGSGEVFDTVENRTFSSVAEWAEDVVGVSDDEYEYGSHKSRFDDDDYY